MSSLLKDCYKGKKSKGSVQLWRADCFAMLEEWWGFNFFRLLLWELKTICDREIDNNWDLITKFWPGSTKWNIPHFKILYLLITWFSYRIGWSLLWPEQRILEPRLYSGWILHVLMMLTWFLCAISTLLNMIPQVTSLYLYNYISIMYIYQSKLASGCIFSCIRILFGGQCQ